MNVGIIGGADGPTVVYIASGIWIFPVIIIAVLLIIVLCVLHFKKKKQGSRIICSTHCKGM